MSIYVGPQKPRDVDEVISEIRRLPGSASYNRNLDKLLGELKDALEWENSEANMLWLGYGQEQEPNCQASPKEDQAASAKEDQAGGSGRA